MKKLLLILLLFATPCFAGDVTLSWDASPSSGVTGYKIYYGQDSFNLEFSKNAGDTLTTDITGLQAGTWYFAATAYNNDAESTLSNVVSTEFEPLNTDDNQHISVTVPATVTISIEVK
ncbi:exported hypothetical protein [uncultured Thiomicrorhabdus sp.]